jgi:NTP pyrophosphatase (non-canonical NTP hydrolase)
MVSSPLQVGEDIPATSIIGDLLNEASRTIQGDNEAKGFYDDYLELVEYIGTQIGMGVLDQQAGKRYIKVIRDMFISSKIALIHSEVSEALEAVRKGIENDDKIPEYSGFEAEMADTLIRVLDLTGFTRDNLGGAFTRKLDYNKGREYKHGKKF